MIWFYRRLKRSSLCRGTDIGCIILDPTRYGLTGKGWGSKLNIAGEYIISGVSFAEQFGKGLYITYNMPYSVSVVYQRKRFRGGEGKYNLFLSPNTSCIGGYGAFSLMHTE
jgi:hypothetical protein